MAANWSLRKKISAAVAVSLLLVGCAVSYLSYMSAIKAMEVTLAMIYRDISDPDNPRGGAM